MILSLHDTAELFLPVPVPGVPAVFPHSVEGETVGQADTADALLVAVARLEGGH